MLVGTAVLLIGATVVFTGRGATGVEAREVLVAGFRVVAPGVLRPVETRIRVVSAVVGVGVLPAGTVLFGWELVVDSPRIIFQSCKTSESNIIQKVKQMRAIKRDRGRENER